jgi:hypothetical protein
VKGFSKIGNRVLELARFKEKFPTSEKGEDDALRRVGISRYGEVRVGEDKGVIESVFLLGGGAELVQSLCGVKGHTFELSEKVLDY